MFQPNSRISLSYLAGRILTIFFKRNFSFEVLSRKIWPMSSQCFALQSSRLVWIWLGWSCSRNSGFVLLKLDAPRGWDGENVGPQYSMYTALYVNFSEHTFACLTLAFATTQFIRKPESWKNGWESQGLSVVQSTWSWCCRSALLFFWEFPDWTPRSWRLDCQWYVPWWLPSFFDLTTTKRSSWSFTDQDSYLLSSSSCPWPLMFFSLVITFFKTEIATSSPRKALVIAGAFGILKQYFFHHLQTVLAQIEKQEIYIYTFIFLFSCL